MSTLALSLAPVEEALPVLQHSLETMRILQHGLNDPINPTALFVWRDISELILAEEVSRLEKTVDTLLELIAATARKEL